MKKTIAILIAVLMLTAVFAGCKDDGNIYEESDYDNVSVYTPEPDTDTSETESSVALTGEIVVKDKIYVYGKKKAVIVTVENNTNKNYSVTICGSFLDEGGKVVSTEEQTFNQYSAGYSGYFLFTPDIEFESFTCTINTAETGGPFHAKDIVLKFHGLEEQMDYNLDSEKFDAGDHEKYPTLGARFSAAYKGSTEDLKAGVLWVMINENDEIVDIIAKDPRPHPGGRENHQSYALFQSTDGPLVWPEEWQGDIKAIPVVGIVTESQDELIDWINEYVY